MVRLSRFAACCAFVVAILTAIDLPASHAADATATLAVTSQWDNGFVANYNITNTGSAPLTDWKLEFDLPPGESITNAWSGKLAHTGSHYVLTPLDYNATIAPGNSVTVGFQAAHDAPYSPPTNCLINGQSCAAAAPPTPSTTTTTTTTSAPATTTPPTTTTTTTTPPPPTAPPAAPASATLAVTSQWPNGFVANYDVANPGTAPISGWKLEFNLPAGESITGSWGSTVTRSGAHYTMIPQSYNNTIAPDSSTMVGFQVAQTGPFAPPADCLINGQPCG